MFDIQINSAWIQSNQKGEKIQQFEKQLAKPQKYKYQQFIKLLDGIISSDLTKSVTEAILTIDPQIPPGCKQLKKQMIKLAQNMMYYIVQTANITRRPPRKKRYHRQEQAKQLILWIDSTTVSIKDTPTMSFLNNKTAQQIWIVYDAAYYILESIGYGRILSIILQNTRIIPLNPCTFLFLLINFFLKMDQIIKPEKYDIQLYSAPIFSIKAVGGLSQITDEFKNSIMLPFNKSMKKRKFQTPKQLFDDLSRNMEVKKINKQTITSKYKEINRQVAYVDESIQQLRQFATKNANQIQTSAFNGMDLQVSNKEKRQKQLDIFVKKGQNHKQSLLNIYNEASAIQQTVLKIVNPISINIKPSMNQKDKFITAAVKYLQIFNSKVVYQQQVSQGMLTNMPKDIALQMIYIQQKRMITGVKLSLLVKQTIFKVQQFRQSTLKISELQKQFNQFVGNINDKLKQLLVTSIQRINVLTLKGQRIYKQHRRIKSIQKGSKQTTKNLQILQGMSTEIYSSNVTVLKSVQLGFNSTAAMLTYIRDQLQQNRSSISNLQKRIQNSIVEKFEELSTKIGNELDKSKRQFSDVLEKLQITMSARFDRIEYAITILYSQTQKILSEINKIFDEIKKISQRLVSIQFYVEKNYQQTNKIQQQLLMIANLVQDKKLPTSIQNLIQLVKSLSQTKQLQFTNANNSLESMQTKLNDIKLPNLKSLGTQLSSMTQKINQIKLPNFNQLNSQIQQLSGRVNNLKPNIQMEPIYESISTIINKLQEQSQQQQQKYKQLNQKVRTDAKKTMQDIFQRLKDDPAIQVLDDKVKAIGGRVNAINLAGLQSQVDRILKTAKLRSSNIQKQLDVSMQNWKRKQNLSSQELKQINQTVLNPIRQILQSNDLPKFKQISAAYKQLVPMIQKLMVIAQNGGGGKQPNKAIGLQTQSVVTRIQKSIEAMKAQRDSADLMLKQHNKQKQNLNKIINELKLSLAGKDAMSQNVISNKLTSFQKQLQSIENHISDMVFIKNQNSQRINFGQNTKQILKNTIKMFLQVIKQKSQFIDDFIKNMVKTSQLKDKEFITGVGNQLKDADNQIFNYIKEKIGFLNDKQMDIQVIKKQYKSFNWWDTSNKRIKFA